MSPPLQPKVPHLGADISDESDLFRETTNLITALTSSSAAPPTSSSNGLQQPLQKSKKRAGALTKIACYECRKRKCKCDGQKPVCGPCRSRDVTCEFDAVAGSEHADQMKTRIRRLEDDKRQLQGQNDSYHSENVSLQNRITQLTSELNRRDFPQQWNAFEASRHGMQMQHDGAGYQLPLTPDSDPQADSGLQDGVIQGEVNSPQGKGLTTNGQLARFLNESRHARQELMMARASPGRLEMSPLDVSSILDASRMPDELSWWASVLPRSHPGTPLVSRLAEAYVTYQQLCYIITGDHEALEHLPYFLRYVLPDAEVCVPHPVTVSSDTSSFMHFPLAAIMSVIDSPQDVTSSISSLLLSSSITGGACSEMGQNPCFAGHDGKVHLTPGFELYVGQQGSWMPKSQLGLNGFQGMVNGGMVNGIASAAA